MAGVVLPRYGPLVGLRYIAQSVVCVLGISVRFCLSPRPPDAFPLDTVVVHRDGPQYIPVDSVCVTDATRSVVIRSFRELVRPYLRSNRSSVITLDQASTKSDTNCCSPSAAL
jgi:hypothetical protein